MRNTIKFTRTAAVLGAGALLLSACGDDAEVDGNVDLSAEATDATTDGEVDLDADADADLDADTEASVSFANLADGDTVASPVEVEFAFEGVTPVAAGEPVEGEGHFHVMVDVPCVTEGEVIPKDDNHLHFGDGATTATLELEAGEHTLCLQFADGLHTATNLTQEITITVE